MSDSQLRVDGAVRFPRFLTVGDLAAIAPSEQVADVSRFHPKRKGDGVTLEAVLALVEPLGDATYLTFHAERDDFHVSVPLVAVRGEGIVVYRLGPNPLGPEDGGPFRFLIKNPAACHTDELDDCANIKYVDRIELTIGKGRDTRPSTEEAHAKLHADP